MLNLIRLPSRSPTELHTCTTHRRTHTRASAHTLTTHWHIHTPASAYTQHTDTNTRKQVHTHTQHTDTYTRTQVHTRNTPTHTHARKCIHLKDDFWRSCTKVWKMLLLTEMRFLKRYVDVKKNVWLCGGVCSKPSPRGLTFTWWGCCGSCLWHKPAELIHAYLFCSWVYFCLTILSAVFHSINSPDDSPLSHSVLLVLFLPHWSFELYISLWKSPSALK